MTLRALITLPTNILTRFDGQLVTAFVFRVAAVTADVREMHFVTRHQFVEFLPEIDVFDLLEFAAFAAFPAFSLPAFHPGRKSLQNVGAVADQFDDCRAFECPQPDDDGHEFHAVVGRPGFPAVSHKLLAALRMPQNKRPPAGAGVAAARPVRKKDDFRVNVVVSMIVFFWHKAGW